MGILDYFGLMTKKSFEEQIEALKKEFMPFEYWQLQTADAEQFTLPSLDTYGNQASLFKRLPAVFISVDIVSSAAALTEFSVARVIQEKEPKDIPNHPFEMLLAKPNPLDSRYEFLYATVAYWMLNKNSYWWLNRADELSVPDEIWTIAPHMITPIPDGNMFLKGYYYYPGNGREIFFPPHEIVHFKGFNPFSSFVGLSAGIESLMNLAYSYLGMTLWNTKLYSKSNGRLPGILSFEQMVADPVWEKIKEDTREAAQNRNLLMLRGVGQGGAAWQQAASTAKDMDFYTGLDKIDKVIMDVLAPGAYTMLFENANEANSRTGRATLNELAVYPKHVVMGEKITSGILPAYGSDKARPLVGKFRDIRVTDRQIDLAEQAEYSKTHTIDEIREEWHGDDPIGDERGDLLLEQVKTFKSEEDKKLELEKQKIDAEAQAQNAKPEQQLASAENKPPADEQKPDEPTKAAIEDLSKWERKAVKRVGRQVDFISEYIPADTQAAIIAALPACNNETAVKMLFEKERVKLKQPKTVATVTPAPVYSEAAILKLADSINALAATEATKRQTQTPPNFYIQQPAHTINMPELQPVYNFNLPNQDAPQTYVNVTPTIEAAKQPDVQISSPVTIHQTVEPAPAPTITTPININQTIEPQEPIKLDIPAPITNVTVENKIPEQSAPVVNVENKVEPTAIKFEPKIEQPAPNVTVVNEVKAPKLDSSEDEIIRDESQNITKKRTKYKYKGDE